MHRFQLALGPEDGALQLSECGHMRRREFLKNLSAGTASLCTGHPLWGQHTGLGAFRMLALTDRLPGNARQMAAWAKENRLSGLEIGNIGGKPLHEFANPRDTAELKATVAAANLTVPSLATSVFLCPLEDEAYGQQLQQLDRCLELARSLGAPLVVVRAFLRRGGLEENWTKLTAYFREPLRRARDAGVTLGVVNDPETFIGTGRELARFIRLAPRRATFRCNVHRRQQLGRRAKGLADLPGGPSQAGSLGTAVQEANLHG